MAATRYRMGLAVSGGADSVALLVLMAEARKEHGFEAVVLHFDHGIRNDSADDAVFVRRLAERFGLQFRTARVKVVRRKGESIEMAARRERLAFFSSCMKSLRLDCIATGHHMDDVAETFIMRLRRASGADGLAGLKPVSFVDGIVFVRPLLNVRGGELRSFLKSRGIAWREDYTNSDTTILRNKVRHVILPFLERELDPKIVEHICRSAGYLREAAFGAERYSSVKDGEKSAPESVDPDMHMPPENFTLEVEDSVGYEITPGEIGRLPAYGWLSADAIKGRTIEVRKWRDGDWMKPCGFPHRRKLQDIFVTSKTPPSVRRTLPIVADGETGEVLWIPGYRVSDSVKVSSKTSPSLRLCMRSERESNHIDSPMR